LATARRGGGASAALACALALPLTFGGCAPAPAPPTPAPVPREPAPPPVVRPAPAPEAPPASRRYGFDTEPRLDVGLRWDVEAIALEALEPVAVTRTRDGVATALGETPGPIQLMLGRGGWTAEWPGGGARDLDAADTLWIGATSGLDDGAARLRWSGRTWRGTFKAFVNPRGKLSLASRLPLEAYLLGVVPGEIGTLAEDLIEAGRAQAIAARSYTLFYDGRRREKEGFDLYATVEDQVYGPLESEDPLATRCVTGTRAQVALSDEWPIRANYSSTCGGITADVWESWPADPLPYLRSRRDRERGDDWCAASRHYRWVERFTIEEFARNLRRFCPERGVSLPKGGVGQILDVRTTGRSRSGRVWRLEVITSNGRITIPAHELRWVLRRAGMPGSILRSTLIKVGVERNRTTRAATAIVVSGGGNGHGVGLCQTGALGMARGGKSAAEILEHYFTGVEVREVY
jgi:stage II sporulation protein D